MTTPVSPMFTDSVQEAPEPKRVRVDPAPEMSHVDGTVPHWIYDSLLRSPMAREDIDHYLDLHAYAHREAEARALAGWAAMVANPEGADRA